MARQRGRAGAMREVLVEANARESRPPQRPKERVELLRAHVVARNVGLRMNRTNLMEDEDRDDHESALESDAHEREQYQS